MESWFMKIFVLSSYFGFKPKTANKQLKMLRNKINQSAKSHVH